MVKGISMRPATLVYFLGVLLLGLGIATAAKELAAIPITVGIGCIIAALFKHFERAN
jgi:hypothetical protein